jgi:hypothetical protein
MEPLENADQSADVFAIALVANVEIGRKTLVTLNDDGESSDQDV